jgi:hypothetical protein
MHARRIWRLIEHKLPKFESQNRRVMSHTVSADPLRFAVATNGQMGNGASLYAPPQVCWESAAVQLSRVRKLVVRYVRPRLSPGGQFLGIAMRHIFTRSPGRECTIPAMVS